MTAEQFREWKRDGPRRSRSGSGSTPSSIISSISGTGSSSTRRSMSSRFLGLVEMFRKAKREFFFLALHRPPLRPELRLLHPPAGIFARRAGSSCPSPGSPIIAIGYFLAHNNKPFFSGRSGSRPRRRGRHRSSSSSIRRSSISRRPTTSPRGREISSSSWATCTLSCRRSCRRSSRSTTRLPAELSSGSRPCSGSSCLYPPEKGQGSAAGRPDGGRLRPSAARASSSGFSIPGTPSIRSRRSHTRRRGRSAFYIPDGKGRRHQTAGRSLPPLRKALQDPLQLAPEARRDQARLRLGERGIRSHGAVLRPAALRGPDGPSEKGDPVHAAGYYRVKGLYLYEIDVDLKKHSTENMQIDPYFFSITPAR